MQKIMMQLSHYRLFDTAAVQPDTSLLAGSKPKNGATNNVWGLLLCRSAP